MDVRLEILDLAFIQEVEGGIEGLQVHDSLGPRLLHLLMDVLPHLGGGGHVRSLPPGDHGRLGQSLVHFVADELEVLIPEDRNEIVDIIIGQHPCPPDDP
ncbi:MAG: hypothetical protein IH968_04455 [Gemmatimonadetes bacterium]|nr:hypothetical protein [Gemmatimonadota bacterium]